MIHLSLKKINGPSNLALDWSKNKDSIQREHFTCSILILNPTMPSGIYLVDKIIKQIR